ncbi:MAG: hypothetical protein IIZ39_10750, partial [Blautia sp.]|nr:hypothetical protein [Blautia sp.]
TIMAQPFFTARLLEASDGLIHCLKDLLAREGQGPEYSLEWPWQDNYLLDYFERLGYFHLMETPANQDKEGHRRIRGIRVTGDVLSLFEKTYTQELDVQRRRNVLMKHLSYLGQGYYKVAPLSVLYEIYQKLAKKDEVLSQEEISKEEFYALYPDAAEEEFSFQEEEEDTYQFEEGDQEVIDELELEDEEGNLITEEVTIYRIHLEEYAESGYDFYIPDASEAEEYLTYYYWPSRPSYKELESYVTKICRERYGKVREDLGEQVSKHDGSVYTMDDAQEDIDRTMSTVSYLFSEGADVETVLEDLKEHGIFREKEEEKLSGLLGECKKVTNLKEKRGYIPGEEVWKKKEEE